MVMISNIKVDADASTQTNASWSARFRLQRSQHGSNVGEKIIIQKQPLTPMKRRNTDQGFAFSPLTDADRVLQVQNNKRQMRRWVQISLH